MEKNVKNVFAFIIAPTPCIQCNPSNFKFVLTLTNISEKCGQETYTAKWNYVSYCLSDLAPSYTIIICSYTGNQQSLQYLCADPTHFMFKWSMWKVDMIEFRSYLMDHIYSQSRNCEKQQTEISKRARACVRCTAGSVDFPHVERSALKILRHQ